MVLAGLQGGAEPLNVINAGLFPAAEPDPKLQELTT
jgi:hypothetical protein